MNIRLSSTNEILTIQESEVAKVMFSLDTYKLVSMYLFVQVNCENLK